MNVLILRREGKIFVTVTADPIGDRGKPERWTDQEVLSYLKNKEIYVGDCLKGGVLTNTNSNKIMNEWIFVDLLMPDSITEEEDERILQELLDISSKKEVDLTLVKKRKDKRSNAKADE